MKNLKSKSDKEEKVGIDRETTPNLIRESVNCLSPISLPRREPANRLEKLRIRGVDTETWENEAAKEYDDQQQEPTSLLK
ncbi:hypothetical protein C922_05566 [Plasmodium inui San Antonio 1]|uniref:Uncharacterized protein n=1 Tax=Plasmodium inui San Antonio 1 TaxID=1237626 RepID=W6ZXS7_9APIC|nr:hypothetical protein C922_05566 [Plasmodium inui San Antonio 1]EUD64050.1 hypothetical protein C922_05566 [Plasmodium inui San Antonio 1]